MPTCSGTERALRGWASGALVEPMTPAQRDWCLDEIASVEGYSRQDYQSEPASTLARGVLDAWCDFARDKGLY